MYQTSIRNKKKISQFNKVNNNNYNIYDIYNRIIDNSGNFMNTTINNITDDEITFSYDLPSSFNYTNMFNNNNHDNDVNDDDNDLHHEEVD